jgi:hypothetical protein
LTPDLTSHELLDLTRGTATSPVDPGCPYAEDWRIAEAEAQRAYDAWRHAPSVDAYTAYRAAEERASAAQDDMTNWVTTMRAWPEPARKLVRVAA